MFETLFMLAAVLLAVWATQRVTGMNSDVDINSILQSDGGAGKRLDEHRELVELLRAKAPDFLQQHPWVNGWLESQDNYLDRLRQDALRRQVIPEYWSRTVRNRGSAGDSHS